VGHLSNEHLSNDPEPRVVSVFVIDDDPEAREVLAAILTTAGYSVVTACDGREALELLPTIRPELIFLDVRMPIVDGLEFRQAQRRNKDWIKIPTIVMTGVEDEPVLDVAVEDTLRKPIGAKDLLVIVARHCTRTV